MARIFYALAALFALIATVVLAVPSFLDWNQHKPSVENLIAEVTGYRAIIAGDLSVSLLPTPRLEIQDLRIAADAGASPADLARVRLLRFDIALLPLLTGRIDTRSVLLVDPVLALETLADGQRNWRPADRPDPEPRTQENKDTFFGGAQLSLGKIEIRGGRVSHRGAASGARHALADINAVIDAAALAAPYRGSGTAITAAGPAGFEFRIGPTENGRRILAAKVTLAELGLTIEQTGIVSDEKGADGIEPRYDGKLRVAGRDAGAVLALAGNAFWRPLLDAAFTGQFTMDSVLAVSDVGFQLERAQANFDNNRVDGRLDYRFGKSGKRGALRADVKLQRIDVDRWRAAQKTPTEKPPTEGPDKAAAKTTPVEKSADRSSAPENLAIVLPTSFDAALDLAVEAVVVNRSIIGGTQVNMSFTGGEVTINQATARLPGGAEVALFGFLDAPSKRPRFEGSIEVKGDNLRSTLDWLSADVSWAPADRLRHWALAGKLMAEPGTLRLSSLKGAVDQTAFQGEAEFTFGQRPVASLSLDMGRLDLDAYLPRARPTALVPEKEKPAPSGQDSARPDGDHPADLLLLPFLLGAGAFDLMLETRLAGVVYNGIPIRNVRLAVARENDTLSIRELSAEDAAGSAIGIQGHVNKSTDTGKHEASIRVRANAPAGLLRRFGLTLPESPRLKGPLEFDAHFVQTGNDYSGEVQLALGAMRTALNGTARLRPTNDGAPLAVEIAADEIDLDLLLAISTAKDARPGDNEESKSKKQIARTGTRNARPGWSDAPFSTGVLDLPAAALTLRTKKLRYLGTPIEDANLRARTGDGRLIVSGLSGRLHGGKLALEGRAERTATGELHLSVDAKLDGADAGAVLPLEKLLRISGGKLRLKLAFEGTGTSQKTLIAGLRGKATLAGTEGEFSGFDLASANHRLKTAKRPSLVTTMAQSARGTTRLKSLSGDFRMAKGVLSTNNLRIAADGGRGAVSGRIDLGKRLIEADFRLRFDAFPEAPPIKLGVAGALGAARIKLDFSKLQTWLGKRRGGKKVPRD